MRRNPTRSAYVYGNLICMGLTKARMCEWYIVSKVKQGEVMQRYPTQSHAIVKQSHATLRKVMQRPPRSCNVMQSYVIMQGKASHTPQLDQPPLPNRLKKPECRRNVATGEQKLIIRTKLSSYTTRCNVFSINCQLIGGGSEEQPLILHDPVIGINSAQRPLLWLAKESICALSRL